MVNRIILFVFLFPGFVLPQFESGQDWLGQNQYPALPYPNIGPYYPSQPVLQPQKIYPDSNFVSKIEINPSDNKGIPGVFTPAIKSGNTIYLSGQIGTDSDGNMLPGLRGQTERIFHKIKSLLRHSGATLADVVKVTVFLTDINDYGDFNKIYKQAFKDLVPPARSAVAVAALPLGATLEIECVAVVA